MLDFSGFRVWEDKNLPLWLISTVICTRQGLAVLYTRIVTIVRLTIFVHELYRSWYAIRNTYRISICANTKLQVI